MPTARHTAELLKIAAREHPDREAYVHGDKRVTYAWLDRAADGFAATLVELGVVPGDVVCLMLGSSIKFAACYLGSLRAGAITSAINLRLGVNEQASILNRTEPAVTVLGDGSEIPPDANAGHGAARLRARHRARPRRAAGLRAADDRRDRSGLHRLDQRHHRRTEGRGLRPRAHGRDLEEHGSAHRAGRPPARGPARSRTSGT